MVQFLLFLLIFTGCKSKTYLKKQNSDVGVVSELNQGKFDQVIQTLSARDHLTSRERYYLASAYSGAGGVDVLSLYPIVEIELFHKSALHWDDLSSDRNPYLRFMETQKNVNEESRKRSRQAIWDRYLPKLEEQLGIIPIPTFESARLSLRLTEKEFQDTLRFYDQLLVKTLELNLDDYESETKFYDVVEAKESSWYFMQFYRPKLRLEVRKRHFFHPEFYASLTTPSSGWELLYMNVLWNTYEAIPIMKALPSISDKEQRNLTASLRTYLPLVENPEFKAVAIKNILIESSVSLLSIYKQSFDLDGVKDVQDLLCTFDPETLFENYGIIRTRLLVLSKLFKAVADDRSFREYQGKLDNLNVLLPEILPEDEKAKFRDNIDRYKLDRCFQG